MENQTTAIGLYCKACSTQADMHHVYMEKGVMYLQGDCPECGESVRFSCDNLLISLMRENPKDFNVQ